MPRRTAETDSPPKQKRLEWAARQIYKLSRARWKITKASSVPGRAGSGRMNTKSTAQTNCVLKQRDPWGGWPHSCDTTMHVISRKCGARRRRVAIRFLSPIFRQARQARLHNPAEHQNNYTRQEQPDPLHSHTIGRFLYFPQDYHRGKSACDSEANPKLGLVDHFPSRREVGHVRRSLRWNVSCHESVTSKQTRSDERKCI